MSIYLKVVSHDDLHAAHVARVGKVQYVNDIDTRTDAGNKHFESIIYTKTEDHIEHTASCNCGHIKVAYLIGTICPICDSEVQDIFERPFEPSAWIRKPEGIDKLISPHLLTLLDEMKPRSFGWVDFILDINNPDVTTMSKTNAIRFNKLLPFVQEYGRGVNNFVKNFDNYMACFLKLGFINNQLYALIQHNRDKWFPEYIPIISKTLIVTESTHTAKYIDKPLTLVVDAALAFTTISYLKSPDKVQQRTARALRSLTDYYAVHAVNRLAKKKGICRKHWFGARLNMSARGVITSITAPHNPRDLHIPWSVGVQLFKYHIMNKYRKRGHTFTECQNFVYGNVRRYNEEMNEIFLELIAESKQGIPCLFSRNPTLQRGSMQALRIVLIKTDPQDNTFSMSAGILKAPNADFDGDQLNLILITDREMESHTDRLAPHLWAFSLDNPHELSGSLEVQAPVIETAANWLSKGRDTTVYNPVWNI